MLPDRRREILLTWDQAGERPWDYLRELGMGAELMSLFEEVKLNCRLYRGGTRNSDLNVGDVKEYNYPSSWSFSKTVASYFIDGVQEGATILVFDCSSTKGVVNDENTYNEHEFILAPINLTVINKKIKNGVTYLYVNLFI